MTSSGAAQQHEPGMTSRTDTSTHRVPPTLSKLQRKGLRKLGNVYCPGDAHMPSFADSGCDQHVDVLLPHMNAADVSQLKLLLTVLAVLPHRLVGILTRWWESVDPNGKPGPISSLLRFLRLGVRGLVFSLYYSGRVGRKYEGSTPLAIIGYDVMVYTGDVN